MSTSYHHFSTEERESLLKYQVEGLKPSEMARRLKRSHSSISRELHRNAEQGGKYSAIAAERKYQQRRKRCVRKRLLDDPEKKAFVEEKLREYWSPEQIAGRLKATGSRLQVSCSTIYRAIHAGQLEITKKCLRRKGRKASPHDEETRGRLHGHKTIHDRPRAANTRSQFGHWEGDTVQGVRGKGALATFVDRRSGFLVACLLPNRKAKVLSQAQCAAFASFPPSLLHCAGEYARRGLVMQLHYSCLRNPNTRAFAELGPDTGFDCIALSDSSGALAKLLDELEKTGSLPRTILSYHGPDAGPAMQLKLLNKQYLRKHGPGAYCGQE